jgi:hypothetical protein
LLVKVNILTGVPTRISAFLAEGTNGRADTGIALISGSVHDLILSIPYTSRGSFNLRASGEDACGAKPSTGLVRTVNIQ